MWLDFVCQERSLVCFFHSAPLLFQVSGLVSFSTRPLSETLDKHQAPSPETVALTFHELPEAKARCEKGRFSQETRHCSSRMKMALGCSPAVRNTGLGSWPWSESHWRDTGVGGEICGVMALLKGEISWETLTRAQ